VRSTVKVSRSRKKGGMGNDDNGGADGREAVLKGDYNNSDPGRDSEAGAKSKE
jgi:hypothetical protein